jgi:plastocyanin
MAILKKVSIFLLVILTGLLSSCTKKSAGSSMPSAPGPGANEVWMQNTAFSPSTITVSVNSTVTWTNKDNMNHNVTSNSGLFSSGTIATAGSYSHQFTAAGTYPYNCTFHPGMNGTVIVQ